MKIIEDDTLKEKPLFFEEEKISEEEKKYRSAVNLMESVECVTRFERAVISLQSAAALFESLGEYKDSVQKKEACEMQAEITQETGMQAAYEAAVDMQNSARTKIDYRTVISEYERFPEYKDSVQRIETCKKKLIRLENRAVWKNRAIVLVVLALAAAIFWVSPAKPFTKGYLRMKQGYYKLAIQHFNEAGDFLNSESMVKKCRYQQALKAYEKGNLESTLKLCKKADGMKDADYLLTRLEIDHIRQSQPGDVISFGKREWVVLSVEGKEVQLLYNSKCREQKYALDTEDREKNWLNSKIRSWLNKTYKNVILNQGERKLLQQVSHDPKGEKVEKLYLLSCQEYQQYERYIPSGEGQDWWLRDMAGTTGIAYYISNGEVREDAVNSLKGARPAIRILLDETLLEDETSAGM